jgi:hypothetical protein
MLRYGQNYVEQGIHQIRTQIPATPHQMAQKGSQITDKVYDALYFSGESGCYGLPFLLPSEP